MAKVFHPHRNGAAVAVGPLESDVLEALWRAGGMQTVPQIHAAVVEGGKQISYSAVKAVLNNLADKGLLRKDRQGKTTSFEAAQTREEFASAVMTSVIGSLKRNYGAPVIARFVDQLAVDEESIEEFERLIALRKQELGQ